MKHQTLVTGGTGMVGKHLRDIMPVATYIGSKDYDLRDYSQALQMLKYHEPNTIIHLAAKVGGLEDNIKNKWLYFEDNMRINMNVIMAARALKIPRMFAVLSSCLYGDFDTEQYPLKEGLIHESTPPESNYGYAIAKRALASAVHLCRQDGFNYTSLIPCNLYSEYGNFDEKAHFINALIKKIYDAIVNESDSIELIGSGRPLRQFMYAGDLALILYQLTLTDGYTNIPNMNIAPDENLSIYKMAEIAVKALCPNLKIKLMNNGMDGQYRKDIDNSVFRQRFPDFKFTPLAEGIKKVYFCENEKLPEVC